MADVPISVDANDVVNELAAQLASVIRENAIMKVQLRSVTSTPTQVAEPQA